MKNINYSYLHCSSEDFKNEISFDEKLFDERLNEAFDLNIQIDRIEVTFTSEKSHETGKFCVSIDIVSPEVSIDVKEEGTDKAGTTRAAIDKTLELLRKHKAKSQSHH
ncbi:MAG: hypothetical protein HC932_01670 [Thermales bacterium]|nr:hypothetical protein [Thermales bacterium]